MKRWCSCGRENETDRDECFLCRVSSVGFGFRGSAQLGRGGWHRSKTEFMNEHLGTTSEKELAARGIERKPS